MINDKKIEQYARDFKLVHPYEDRFLQPHSIDLRLGGNFKVAKGETKNHYEDIWLQEREVYRIAPKSFVLGHTIEFINLPPTLVGFVAGKSSVARAGLQIECAGLIDAAFHGQITLELYNMSPWALDLQVGMPICQAYFNEVEKPEIKDYAKIGHYCGQTGARQSYLFL